MIGRRPARNPPTLPGLAVLCVLAVLLGLGPIHTAAAAPAVTGLRFGIDGHRTRIVIDLDQPIHYEVGTGQAPERLFLDLDQVAWRLPASVRVPPRGLAQRYAFAPLGPGRARLTIEMAGPFRVIGNIILPPNADSARHRLVIDLVPSARTPERPAVAESAVAVPLPSPRPDAAATEEDRPDLATTATAGHRPVIVIDPGHGGVDPGAVAVDGSFEKELVLEMALELRRLIEQTGRYRVALTREDDTFISLRDRITRTRELGGEIFISLHADSLRVAEQRGASVYTISENASDIEAERLANQENKTEILAGTDLSQHDAVVATILLDLAQRDTNNRSITFADLLAEEMATVATMLRKHRRFAGFAVLKSPDIPSVLLELGYLSNPDDARNLAQPDYRARLSRAIVRALDRFFAVPRP